MSVSATKWSNDYASTVFQVKRCNLHSRYTDPSEKERRDNSCFERVFGVGSDVLFNLHGVFVPGFVFAPIKP